MKSRVLLAVFFVVGLIATCKVQTIAASTAVLWGIATITVPGNMDFFDANPPPGLGVLNHEEVYVFISEPIGYTALTAQFIDAADPLPPPLGAIKKSLQVNGLPAIREDGLLYSRIVVSLPPPKGCSVRNYIMLVFTRGDAAAERFAKSLRLKPNFPCLNAVP